MQAAITIDIGTTDVKLCMLDAQANMVAFARHGTPVVGDRWGEAYDLDALHGIIIDFITSMDAVHRASVQRIAITGVGESGGLVRADLSLASPMILWHDHRGARYLSDLAPADRALIYRITGLPVNANYGLSKVAWAAEHAGSAVGGGQWLNISEYLAASMTNRRWSEYSLASRTMAFDLASHTWSAPVCALLGLDVSIFPELRPATDGSQIAENFARQVGLSYDVNVHVGGHDHMVGGIGAGLRHGELLNSTGTTEGLLFVRDTPSCDERSEKSKLANGASCAGSDFTLFASIPTGGSAFSTLQSMLNLSAEALMGCIADLYERYIAGAFDPRSAPLVLPQFRGSAPPAKSASARALIAGLDSGASAEQVVFGCFLGMSLQLSDVLGLFPQGPERVKVIGPASRNPLWLQLKADLLGVPLSVSRFPEVVSRGAQALASDLPCEWETSRPRDVHPGAARTTQLGEWAAENRQLWEYLKGAPE